MDKSFYEKHAEKLAAIAAGLDVGQLTVSKDKQSYIWLTIEPPALPAPRWRLYAGGYGSKPGFIELSLLNEKNWGHYSNGIRACANIARPTKSIIADLMRRCVVPGITYFKEQFRKAAERESAEKLDRQRILSILGELDADEFEDANFQSDIRSYKYDFSTSNYDLKGPYRAEICVHSEFAFRQILRIIREDWKVINKAG